MQSAKNNVVAQASLPSAQLRVITEVINDDGISNKTAEDFSIAIFDANVIDILAGPVPGAPPPDGTTFDLVPGTYSVRGLQIEEHDTTIEGDCDSNGRVTLAAGEPPKTCTVIFDDTIPGHLIVVTDVINDNNGTLQASDFLFKIVTPEGQTGEISGVPPPNGRTFDILSSDLILTVEQNPVPGYNTTLEGDCINVTVAQNQTKTCTIINNDVAPAGLQPEPTPPADETQEQQPTHGAIRVNINVINDNGGNKTASDFTIRITSADGTEVAAFQLQPEARSRSFELLPGTYIVTHDPVPDYTTTFGLACDSAGQVTVTLVGIFVDCEVTFDDIAPPPPDVSPPPVEDDQTTVTDELVPTQSEAGLCDDGIDNDQDGRVDLQDEDCEQEEELEEEEDVDQLQERLEEEAQERLEEELEGIRELTQEEEEDEEEEEEEPQAPVAITGDNIYIAWWTNNTENGNEEVMFRASSDGGATFSDRINLSNTTDADSELVEISAEGENVVVSWWERTIMANQTTTTTGTNQTEGAAAAPESVPVMRVSNDAGETFGPMLMLGANGTIGVTEEEGAVEEEEATAGAADEDGE